MSTLFIYITNEKETMDLDYVNKVSFFFKLHKNINPYDIDRKCNTTRVCL